MLRKEEKTQDIAGGDIIAFLGKGTEFKGVITYQGTVRIDGRVEGEIITEGTLIVGETASIQAEISAGTIISGGKIVGNITATEKIQLLPSAVLEGSMKSPVVAIEEGVRFNGSCQMGGSVSKEKTATVNKGSAVSDLRKEAASAGAN
ncbi:MAG TPA: polymer-forming cytoskeletal protein [Nitrospiria bacterium]|nr:polymer-forming cytoskeletal protein [Nitrospiria bacterium]